MPYLIFSNPQKETSKRGPSSPRGFAGSSTGDSTAQGAHLNTSALDVGNLTPLPNATTPKQLQLRDQNPTFPTVGALPTPVKVERLALYLEAYKDSLYHQLLSGFLQGFRLHFEGPQIGQISNNLLSATQHPEIVDNKLANEIQEGRIIGPHLITEEFLH